MPEGVSMRKILRPSIAIVALVLAVGYCGWTAVAIHSNYISPKDRAEKRFVSDLNSDLGVSSSGGYKDGQATITVYRVLDADRQASVRAGLVRTLARHRDQRPATVKSVRIQFCRDYDDHEVLAEFEIPAVITPELEREWGEDPLHPSTRRAPP
jgi:hypothetical protein